MHGEGFSGGNSLTVYVAIDLGYVEQQRAGEIMQVAEVVARRIAGFIKYLKSTT